MNTVFRLLNCNKTSWMHPNYKHWHLTEHVIVWRNDIHNVNVMCIRGTDCWTDHTLVVSKFNLQGDQKARKLGVSKLKQVIKRQAFNNNILNHLDAVQLSSEDPDENWRVFRKAAHSSQSSAVDTQGYASRKHQNWFDE